MAETAAFSSIRSANVNRTSAAPVFSTMCAICVVPGMGTIHGTTKRTRLEENIGAVDVQLTPDELHAIHEAAARIAVQGARYPEHLARLLGR